MKTLDQMLPKEEVVVSAVVFKDMVIVATSRWLYRVSQDGKTVEPILFEEKQS